MSLVRSFAHPGEVRLAVAKSLGFGLRETAPYDEAEEMADDEPPAGPAEAAQAAAAEVSQAEPPGEEPDAETEADKTLREIMQRIEAEEASAKVL